jgi:hypothetical protein
MNRQKLIARRILTHLDEVFPYQLDAKTLLDGLNLNARPPYSQAEFDDSLDLLKGLRAAVETRDELDPENPRWCITEIGKTFLRATG